MSEAASDSRNAISFATATESGAILADVTRAERRKVADFGRELGLAFQLKDDALDYEAGAAELGKEPFADLREGKMNHPLLIALERDPERHDAFERSDAHVEYELVAIAQLNQETGR